MVRAENKVFDLVPGIWEELPSVVSYCVFSPLHPPCLCSIVHEYMCVLV